MCPRTLLIKSSRAIELPAARTRNLYLTKWQYLPIALGFLFPLEINACKYWFLPPSSFFPRSLIPPPSQGPKKRPQAWDLPLRPTNPTHTSPPRCTPLFAVTCPRTFSRFARCRGSVVSKYSSSIFAYLGMRTAVNKNPYSSHKPNCAATDFRPLSSCLLFLSIFVLPLTGGRLCGWGWRKEEKEGEKKCNGSIGLTCLLPRKAESPGNIFTVWNQTTDGAELSSLRFSFSLCVSVASSLSRPSLLSLSHS